MKARFVFFDEVALELSINLADEGASSVRGMFLTFLGRRAHPHLTLFGEPERGAQRLTPHFTAARGFRRRLPTIDPSALPRAVDRLLEGMAEERLATLQPADFHALETEGWTVHAPDFTALYRWIRLASTRADFRVDERVYDAIARQLVRRRDSPLALVSLRPEVLVRLVLLRADERGEPQGQALLYSPIGFSRHPAGAAPTRVLEPGWYTQDFAPSGHVALESALPVAQIRKAGSDVRKWLKLFPKRETERESSCERSLRELDPLLRQLVAFYAPELFNLSLHAKTALARAKRS